VSLDAEFSPDHANPARPLGDAFDEIWARQVLSDAVELMQAECTASGRPHIWGVFQGLVLTPILEGNEPVAYAEVVANYGFESPSEAYNVLATAKRMYARMIRAVVGAYERTDADIDSEIADLYRVLSRSAR
jgi:hypothetical protein